LLAEGSQPDANLAPVVAPAYPLHKTAVHQPVRKANGAVMPDQQVRGDFSYVGTMSARQRADSQQELMLLGLESLGSGRLFAEMEKAADLKPKIGKRSIIRIRQVDGVRGR